MGQQPAARHSHTQRTPKEPFVYFRIKETRQTDRGDTERVIHFAHTHTHTPTWEKKKENLSVLMPYVIEMRVAVRASTMKTTRRIKY